ncbi:hypothetical protein O1Q79_01567 [Lonepinella sp. MS14434]
MPQHFLLSHQFRNLSLAKIATLSDSDILTLLKTARWGKSDNQNQVVCPRCHTEHQAYFIASRKQWQCKH